MKMNISTSEDLYVSFTTSNNIELLALEDGPDLMTTMDRVEDIDVSLDDNKEVISASLGVGIPIPSGGGSGLPDPSAADKMLISNDSLEWEEIDKEDVGTPTWTGTQAEYDAAKSDIADGTIVNITDDDGNMVGARTTEIYSTDEIIVGRWIDGKPIYRKCFQASATYVLSNDNWNVINEIVVTNAKLRDFKINSNGVCVNGLWAYMDNQSRLNLQPRGYNSAINIGDIIVLEYTKTT